MCARAYKVTIAIAADKPNTIYDLYIYIQIYTPSEEGPSPSSSSLNRPIAQLNFLRPMNTCNSKLNTYTNTYPLSSLLNTSPTTFSLSLLPRVPQSRPHPEPDTAAIIPSTIPTKHLSDYPLSLSCPVSAIAPAPGTWHCYYGPLSFRPQTPTQHTGRQMWRLARFLRVATLQPRIS